MKRSTRTDNFALLALLLAALVNCFCISSGQAEERTSLSSGQGDKPIGGSYQGEIEIDTAVSPDLIKVPAQQIDDLVDKVVAESPACSLRKSSKLLGRILDMAQYCSTCKGFESSSEAADVILSEKASLKSKAAAEYVQQKKYDSLHSQVTACVLQIATGLGTAASELKRQRVENGIEKLRALVGGERALKCLNLLTAWSERVKDIARVIDEEPWDVLQIQDKSAEVLSRAVQSDTVTQEIANRLHKYNRHSNLSRVSAKLINTALSATALCPTIVSPAAQLTQVIYIALTGGPEEAKLLKEVYLDRRLEERCRRLTQEVNLLLTNYNMAKVTHNRVLLSCSQSIIEGLVGVEATAALLQNEREAKNQAVSDQAPANACVFSRSPSVRAADSKQLVGI